MVNRAEDPQWLPKQKNRAGNLTYKVENDTLIVQRKNRPEERMSMGEETDALTALVVRLEELNVERDRRVLQVYDKGLHNYITRMLQTVVPWVKENGWQKVADTLQNYKERESLGFRHDEQGRQQWLQHLDETDVGQTLDDASLHVNGDVVTRQEVQGKTDGSVQDMDDEPQDEEETTSGGFNHWSGRAQATRRERYNAQTADSSDAEGDMYPMSSKASVMSSGCANFTDAEGEEFENFAVLGIQSPRVSPALSDDGFSKRGSTSNEEQDQREENRHSPTNHGQKGQGHSLNMDDHRQPQDMPNGEVEDMPIYPQHQEKMGRPKRVFPAKKDIPQPPATKTRQGKKRPHGKEPQILSQAVKVIRIHRPLEVEEDSDKEQPEDSDQEQCSPKKKARHQLSSKGSNASGGRGSNNVSAAGPSSAPIHRGSALKGRFATPFFDLMVAVKAKNPPEDLVRKMHLFFNTITGPEHQQDVEQMLRTGPPTLSKIMRDIPGLGARDAKIWRKMQEWARAGL